jgi:hypothetical protein
MDNNKSPAPAGRAGQQGSAAAADLWRFAPLTDFRPPSPPVSSAAGRTWSSLTWLFGGGGDKAQPSVPDREELQSLAPDQMARLAPLPDWSAAAASLDHALADWWRQDRPQRPVRFLIGPPFSGQAEMVHRWGTALGATVITEPTSEQILGADFRWLEDWPDTAPLWVLPRLERCFLRHAGGLSLVRRLLDRAQGGTLGCGLIGCDSWAWAFLEYAWPVVRPDALAVQAFDAEGLARLLAVLATPRAGERIRFRNARSGDDLFAAPFAEGDPVPSGIAHLAAHCRGNAGLAANLWRQRLCARPDRDEAAESTEDDQPAEVIYVADAIPEIRPSAGCSEEEVLLLHTLLVHHGLAEPLLGDLLPLPASRTAAGLRRLQRDGLAELHDGRWQVAAPAYVAVRDLLRGRDYLCDAC